MPGVNSKNIVYNSFNLDKELTQVNPVKALTSGKIKMSDIGKTVYLSNSKSPCQEWQIADVNHDSTTGTVDLISKYVLISSNTTAYNGYALGMGYKNSELRKILNDSEYGIYLGFANEVIELMKSQPFTSDFSKEQLSDKIKAPTITELGIKGTVSYTRINIDGTIYPIFGSSFVDFTNDLAKRKNVSGSYTQYWTRSYYDISDEARHIYISENGMALSSKCNASKNCIGIIRF